MEKINLNDYLASNEYPGRGIAVAMAPDGRQMFIGYFIMGRSENSRNRVFDLFEQLNYVLFRIHLLQELYLQFAVFY